MESGTAVNKKHLNGLDKSALMDKCKFNRQNGLHRHHGGDYKSNRLFYKNINQSSDNCPEAPLLVAVLVYVQYAVLIFFGYLRDLLRLKVKKVHSEHARMKDFVPLYSDFESFYTRNLYFRIKDAWNRPIRSVPGATMQVEDVKTSEERNRPCLIPAINLGSYNYLGFAQNDGPCARESANSIRKFGVGTCSTKNEFGESVLQRKLERCVASFLGVEAAVCFPMGFSTNSTNLPCLIGKGCLVLSDELNHASIILGCRLSGANIIKFKHNDVYDLENRLRKAIIQGQPRTGRPYKKIMICVEGVYSMEGTICNLPNIIALKKRYKAYIYLDEAHSIGAIGKHGRGVCDYYGCNPNDVDVLMGTFTKSFGSAGGYIAGNKKLINHLRINGQTANYGATMSAPVAQQIISAIAMITGQDGTNDGARRIKQLSDNSVYFRQRLKNSGFIVYGDRDSPVVPLMVYHPSKMSYLSRELLKHKIGVVVVGFPATALTLARARFCISASHTKQQLDEALNAIEQIGRQININYLKRAQCDSVVSS